jgi:hypothetical protein
MSIFDWLGYLDWITPALSLMQDTNVFSVPQDRSGEAIHKLQEAGVKIKNKSFLPGRFVFDVKPKDADKVRKLLGASGDSGQREREPELQITSEWTCSYCGQRNPGWSYRCQGCGHQ